MGKSEWQTMSTKVSVISLIEYIMHIIFQV